MSVFHSARLEPDEIFKVKSPLMLSEFTDYAAYCLETFREKLALYTSVARVAADLDQINAYENSNALEPPRNILLLDEERLSMAELKQAEDSILAGRILTEHTATGEATRLGMGTNYLINLAVPFSLEKIASLVTRVTETAIGPEEFLSPAGCSPEDLLPLALGSRHMFQLSFDITRLANRRGYDPKEVLGRQHLLIILNECSAKEIIAEFRENAFFGFSRQNVYFMIQKSYFGINVVRGHLYYDGNSPELHHNHGQMAMQQTADNEIFHIREGGIAQYLSSRAFGELLKRMDVKVSCNIEDLEYLTSAIDIPVLALSLKKATQGYNMLLEIVATDPENPKKGGVVAYDPIIGRNVIVEDFQLNEIENRKIHLHNRNLIHYPNPYNAWCKIKQKGLNIPVAVKGDHLYGQAVQGDINFLVKTEFVGRTNVKPMQTLKLSENLPIAMRYMRLQDLQERFRDYVEVIIG